MHLCVVVFVFVGLELHRVSRKKCLVIHYLLKYYFCSIFRLSYEGTPFRHLLGLYTSIHISQTHFYVFLYFLSLCFSLAFCIDNSFSSLFSACAAFILLSKKIVFMSYDVSFNSRIWILFLIWDLDSSFFNIFTSICSYGQIYFKFLATHHLNLHHLQLFLLFVFNLGFHLCLPGFCHVE